MKFVITFMAICMASFAYAEYEFPLTLNDFAVVNSNQLSIEPRISRACLSGKNLNQKGNLYGLKANYNFLVYGYPYVGVESSYMKGKLTDGIIKSHYRDFLFEGKLGYTLGQPAIYTLVPYLGLGYEREKNYYSPVPNYKITYNYLSVGILSEFYMTACASFGINFKAKFPFSGKNHVKKGIETENISLCKNAQYYVEIPFTYWVNTNLSLALSGFYDYKTYKCLPIDEQWVKNSKLSQYGLGARCTLAF